MSEVVSKIITIKADSLPPSASYIEENIKRHGIEALRWAIVDIKEKELVISVSGRKL